MNFKRMLLTNPAATGRTNGFTLQQSNRNSTIRCTRSLIAQRMADAVKYVYLFIALAIFMHCENVLAQVNISKYTFATKQYRIIGEFTIQDVIHNIDPDNKQVCVDTDPEKTCTEMIVKLKREKLIRGRAPKFIIAFAAQYMSSDGEIRYYEWDHFDKHLIGQKRLFVLLFDKKRRLLIVEQAY